MESRGLGSLVSKLDALVPTGNRSQTSPDPLACFEALTKLLAAVKQEAKEVLTPLQRQVEDKLEALLLLGVPPPVRRLASETMSQLIEHGDNISIYSRLGGLQGWLSDNVDKRREPTVVLGVAMCVGSLTRKFGRQLTSSLQETASIVARLMRSSDPSLRLAGMQLLSDALAGTAGGGSPMGHAEAARVVTRVGAVDKVAGVRAAAANCLQTMALVGGPGLHSGGLEGAAALCVKGLEDPDQAVRDGFAAALGAILALGLKPEAQVQPKGKGGVVPAPPKAMDAGIARFVVQPFSKATGPRAKDVRFSLASAWVALLQVLRHTYGLSDTELPAYGLQAIQALVPVPGSKTASSVSFDVQAQACIIYVVRVGVVEQLGESAQRAFLDLLVKQLVAARGLAGTAPAVVVVTLRAVAYLLDVLGEISVSTREALDSALVGLMADAAGKRAVVVEVALAAQALALVDPECANGLMSVGVTMLRAMRETLAVEKGERLRAELDALHGQATVLAALLAAAPKLPLGVPSRFSQDILNVARQMIQRAGSNQVAAGGEKEVGWILVGALVSSLREEELEENEELLLSLWGTPFGGDCAARLKKVEADKSLTLELPVWVAAMEALGAFIKHSLVPSLTGPAAIAAEARASLLPPVLSYLSGAVVYLSSPVLQESAPVVRPLVDLLTIFTLEAYRSLPDASAFKPDHVSLLTLCTAPFRDATSTPASSCLAILLNPADAVLGPWVPGRSSLEDELRRFEGGSDSLLPCAWRSDRAAFPQPLPRAVALVDAALLCFGTVFTSQSERNKLQLLEILNSSLKAARKSAYRITTTTNASVALLGGLRAAVSAGGGVGERGGGGTSSRAVEPAFWKRSQATIAAILASADTSASDVWRAMAEAHGLVAKLMDDSSAARWTRSLISEITAPGGDRQAKAAASLALGCIHRRVGGMALSALVPATVQALSALAKDGTDGQHVWALHALWLTADAAGLAYFPHVQPTLALVLETLLSEVHTAAPALRQTAARLVNGMVAVLGPELAPGGRVFTRCQAIIGEIGAADDDPAAQLECVLFGQQLVLFAPQAAPTHALVSSLRSTLSSQQPSLRKAAVATLRHLSERDPLSMVPERIEEDLFAMLDRETDPDIIRGVRLTLERLLEAACPSLPSRWLRLCRNVILAAASARVAGTSGPEPERAAAAAAGAQSAEDGGLGENDEEGFNVAPGEGRAGGSGGLAGPGPVQVDATRGADLDRQPRYRTRVFASECLLRIPMAVSAEREHFDLELAQERVREAAATTGQDGGDWLVLHLSELVALAYQVVTGALEFLRPKGVALLNVVLDRFGRTSDPHFEGHLLLEQYQAQLVSAVRTSFEPSAGPLLLAEGACLAAAIVAGGIAADDRGVLQRVLGMLSSPLSKWSMLSYPSHAEWVGCKVKVALLEAIARVKNYGCAGLPSPVLHGPGSSSPSTPVAEVLRPLLAPHGPTLARCWVGLLRDYAVAHTQPAAVQARYQPFLQENSHSAAASAAVHPYLCAAWTVVLEAITEGAVPQPSPLKSDWGVSLDSVEYGQVWGLATSALCESSEGSPGPILRALCSLTGQPFCEAGYLSASLCKEVLQVLLDLPAAASQEDMAFLTMELVEQLASALPEDFLAGDGTLALAAVELVSYHFHRLMGVSQRASSSDMHNRHPSTGMPNRGASTDKTNRQSGAGVPSRRSNADATRRGSGTAELSRRSSADGHGTSVGAGESTLISASRALAVLGGRSGGTVQAVVVPQLMIAALHALETVPTKGPVLGSVASLVTALANAGRPGDSHWGNEARAPVLASMAKSLAVMAEQVAARMTAPGPDASDAEGRLAVVLALLGMVAKAVPAEAPGQAARAWQRYVECMRTMLGSPAAQVQMAGLQVLRTALQAAVTEQQQQQNNNPGAASGPQLTWAAELAGEVGTDACAVIKSGIEGAVRSPGGMSQETAAVIGECLKVLLLLHQVAQGDTAQREALQLLLPAVITAATPPPGSSDLSPAQAALAGMGVKLVTHLASVPASALQFKAVVAELPAESKQQLQAAIRATVAPQPGAGSQPGAPQAPPRLVVPLPVAPVGSGGGLAPPPLAPPGTTFKVTLPARAKQEEACQSVADDDWDDEEWDDPVSAPTTAKKEGEGGGGGMRK